MILKNVTKQEAREDRESWGKGGGLNSGLICSHELGTAFPVRVMGGGLFSAVDRELWFPCARLGFSFQ